MILGYKYEDFIQIGIKVPVDITLSKKTSHLLISGKSGSGKSLSARWYLWQILHHKEGRVFIADYKGGEEYESLEGSAAYASGPNAINLINSFYQFYTVIRSNRIRLKKYHALYIEEWAGLLSYVEAVFDKKEKTALLSKVGEMQCVGRGLNLGIILVIQRPDAAFFQNGSREQFQCIINFGRCSSDAFKMLGFASEMEDNPTFAYQPGQALAYIDGQSSVQELIIPRISNETEMCRQIRRQLDKQPAIDLLARAAAEGKSTGQ